MESIGTDVFLTITLLSNKNVKCFLRCKLQNMLFGIGTGKPEMQLYLCAEQLGKIYKNNYNLYK